MPPANSKVLISFDLDFTLINNKEGIVNSFNHALNKHGVQEIAAEEIEKMIGIPLHEMFEKVSDLNPSQLSASFREYYGR
ncbi:MAG: HAD hydrolase-like protein [Promethearchaeota archaeon]